MYKTGHHAFIVDGVDKREFNEAPINNNININITNISTNKDIIMLSSSSELEMGAVP